MFLLRVCTVVLHSELFYFSIAKELNIEQKEKKKKGGRRKENIATIVCYRSKISEKNWINFIS